MLWHAGLLHRGGENHSTDVMRFASLHAFVKTPESVPDSIVLESNGDIWRDWSDELQDAAAAAARGGARL